MESYKINKGINKPIEFKGLKGQYIGYMIAGLLFNLLVFGMLYGMGVAMNSCLLLLVFLSILVAVVVSRLNARYGEFGLMKKWAEKQVPRGIRVSNRNLFKQLARREEWN
ncbi:DUF4133 domain-containing protein [Algoriphagus pacificus]|uniref:DUF4133 domain-containing protein n=1 Tax=Algoriphagus pacificus TaxID=2811234 RepID=A0ABS3CK71_9BACT|nr:DUF4133 domain-containing protein [Algoriphagus pacificus]MBN7817477.1 DUF4133 domain-containing protein [Algoriphagus pacificus]